MAGLAHQKLAALAQAKDAKRLMALSLGETRVIVTCNPNVAKQILNSSVFADRPVKESAYGLMFHRAMGFAPYGACVLENAEKNCRQSIISSRKGKSAHLKLKGC